MVFRWAGVHSGGSLDSFRPSYKDSRDLNHQTALWHSPNYLPLVRVMRQCDEAFAGILTEIGNGDPLLPKELTLIDSRVRIGE